ncbi:PIN domain-containing protein [Rubrivirga sp.]|uniref:PIN domain-containing protein n=1 Tax=Rubrivirga sp. TaxID=1885344 RepID=UPI003B51EC08
MNRPRPILIDTCIFESERFDVKNSKFSRISELCQFEVGRLASFPALDREIREHMREYAANARAQLRKASIASIGVLEPGTESLLTPGSVPAPDSLFKEMEARYDSYLQSSKSANIGFSYVSLPDVVDRYFYRAAPFCGKKPKEQMIDALTLSAAENWGEWTGREVLLVSNDEQWIEFNNDSKYTVIFRKLDTLIDFLTRQGGVKSFGGDYSKLSDHAFDKARSTKPTGGYVITRTNTAEPNSIERDVRTFGDLLEEIRFGHVYISISSKGAKLIHTSFISDQCALIASRFPNRLALYHRIAKSQYFQTLARKREPSWPQETLFYIAVISGPESGYPKHPKLVLGSGETITDWESFSGMAVQAIQNLRPSTEDKLTRTLRTAYHLGFSHLERSTDLEEVRLISQHSATG